MAKMVKTGTASSKGPSMKKSEKAPPMAKQVKAKGGSAPAKGYGKGC